jgi:putative ABC transport system permease protein
VTVLGLALRNIVGNAYRSGVIILCVMVLASLSLTITLVVRGAEDSVRLAVERLGADVVVMPRGVETRVETALITGKPTSSWMSAENLQKARAISGVAVASPQLFLASLSNASCCAVSEMFLIVYDPATDFTIQPWLQRKLGKPLGLGEAVGGSYVFVPEGDEFIMLYGYFLTLKATLEPTGTGLDQTMFMNLDTAQDMARISLSRAKMPLQIPRDKISAIMIRVQPGTNPRDVVQRINRDMPDVTAVESSSMFRSLRDHLTALSRGMTAILAITWAFAVVLIGFIFGLAAHERRREVGVMRALGATSLSVFRSLLTEAIVMALAGSLGGIVLSGVAVYLFARLIGVSLGIPFLFPSLLEAASLVALSLALPLAAVLLAALLPALTLSRQESALAMRE